jgi:hypothetical protein
MTIHLTISEVVSVIYNLKTNQISFTLSQLLNTPLALHSFIKQNREVHVVVVE